ncbi:MAG: glycerophosphodiester phosphodiesterase family protein, partial [Candidatus Thorarchaeota archaeon]
NLDIKDSFPSAPMELARIISKMNRKDTVIVASFHNYQLERFRELSPEVLTSAHPGEVKRFVLNSKFGLPRIKTQDIQYRAFQVPIKSGPLTVVTKKFVRKAHELDLVVHVWTINDVTTMNYLLDLGVDGIFTDQPVLLREVLEKRGFL